MNHLNNDKANRPKRSLVPGFAALNILLWDCWSVKNGLREHTKCNFHYFLALLWAT